MDYKPVYKKLTLGWQIAKQLSGFNRLSVSNNKDYRLKKSGGFFCNKFKMAIKSAIHQNSAVSKALLGNFKITDRKYQF